MNFPLLSVRDLSVRFLTDDRSCSAVNGVSFDVKHGEAVGIVGESGSGKTVTCLALVRLLPSCAEVAATSVQLEGRSVLDLPEREMRKLRGREIAVVFQNPMSALNPYLSIERQLTEGMQLHLGLSRKQASERAIGLLARVAIPEPEKRIAWYPFQFSGGMSQRVMIAMALACDPKLVIADEPTTALDATVQAEILDLLTDLRKPKHAESVGGMGILPMNSHGRDARATSTAGAKKPAMLFISHDLDIVGRMCERVLVMYGGRIVEEGPSAEIMAAPLHPYTKALLECVPRLTSPRVEGRLPTIPGAPPSATDLPPGCVFHPRCPQAEPRCKETVPPLIDISTNRRVACVRKS